MPFIFPSTNFSMPATEQIISKTDSPQQPLLVLSIIPKKASQLFVGVNYAVPRERERETERIKCSSSRIKFWESDSSRERARWVRAPKIWNSCDLRREVFPDRSNVCIWGRGCEKELFDAGDFSAYGIHCEPGVAARRGPEYSRNEIYKGRGKKFSKGKFIGSVDFFSVQKISGWYVNLLNDRS